MKIFTELDDLSEELREFCDHYPSDSPGVAYSSFNLSPALAYKVLSLIDKETHVV